MAVIDDFRTVVRDYLVHPEYSDVLVDSFIRQAESNLSRNMRVKEMVIISDAPVVEARVALPKDWRELEYVRFNNGKTLELVDRDKLFGASRPHNYFTLVGDYITFGNELDVVDGTAIEIAYYAAAPHLAAGESWLHKFYYDIFLHSAVAAGFIYAVEPEKSSSLLALTQQLVSNANDEHTMSKSSGSVIKMGKPKRSFG